MDISEALRQNREERGLNPHELAKALGVKSAPYFRIGEAEYGKRAAMAIRCVEERLG